MLRLCWRYYVCSRLPFSLVVSSEKHGASPLAGGSTNHIAALSSNPLMTALPSTSRHSRQSTRQDAVQCRRNGQLVPPIWTETSKTGLSRYRVLPIREFNSCAYRSGLSVDSRHPLACATSLPTQSSKPQAGCCSPGRIASMQLPDQW